MEFYAQPWGTPDDCGDSSAFPSGTIINAEFCFGKYLVWDYIAAKLMTFQSVNWAQYLFKDGHPDLHAARASYSDDCKA